MAAKPSEELTAADMRRLIPTIGEFRVSGIEFLADSGAAHRDEGVKGFTIGSIELKADKPIENIPTDMRLAVRNVGVALDPASGSCGCAASRFAGDHPTALSGRRRPPCSLAHDARG